MQKTAKLTEVMGVVPQGAPFDPKVYLTRNLPKIAFRTRARLPPARQSQNLEAIQGVVPQGAPFDPKYSQTGITVKNVKGKKEEIDAIVSRQTAIRDDITASRLGDTLNYENRSKNYKPIVDALSQLGLAGFATAKDATGQIAALIRQRLIDFMRGKTQQERVAQLPAFLKQISDDLLQQVNQGGLAPRMVPEIIRMLEGAPLAPELGPDAPEPPELAAHVRRLIDIVGDMAGDIRRLRQGMEEDEEGFERVSPPPESSESLTLIPSQSSSSSISSAVSSEETEETTDDDDDSDAERVGRLEKEREALLSSLDQFIIAIEAARGDGGEAMLKMIEDNFGIIPPIILDPERTTEEVAIMLLTGAVPIVDINKMGLYGVPIDVITAFIERSQELLALLAGGMSAAQVLAPLSKTSILFFNRIRALKGVAAIPDEDEDIELEKEFAAQQGENNRTFGSAVEAIPALESEIRRGTTTEEKVLNRLMSERSNAADNLAELFDNATPMAKNKRASAPFSAVINRENSFAVYSQLFEVLRLNDVVIIVRALVEQTKAGAYTRVKPQGPEMEIDTYAFYAAVRYLVDPSPQSLLDAEIAMYFARVDGSSANIRELFKWSQSNPKGISDNPNAPSVGERKRTLNIASLKGFGRAKVFNKVSAKLDKLLKSKRITRPQYIAGQKKLAELLS